MAYVQYGQINHLSERKQPKRLKQLVWQPVQHVPACSCTAFKQQSGQMQLFGVNQSWRYVLKTAVLD